MNHNISKILKNKSFWLSVLLFVLALLPRITTLSHTFIVNDEPLYWDWSNEFANALANLDWYGTLIGKGYPSITVMWVHTLGSGSRFLVEFLTGHPPADFWQRDALDQRAVADLDRVALVLVPRDDGALLHGGGELGEHDLGDHGCRSATVPYP